MNLQRTIMIVEDERALSEAIGHKLKTYRFNVAVVRATDEAIELLRGGLKVDAIWMDHYLFGKKSGLDLMVRLHDNRLWKNLPVFVVSNTVSPDKVKTYMSLGAKKYYTKVDNRLDQIVNDITLELGVVS
ncbi:response regulator [Candidatus Saccharibacteria bacterium]|nr:response regulator [Candidatus Saccharibacteria bacterium]